VLIYDGAQECIADFVNFCARVNNQKHDVNELTEVPLPTAIELTKVSVVECLQQMFPDITYQTQSTSGADIAHLFSTTTHCYERYENEER
jgi:hypothetical protein